MSVNAPMDKAKPKIRSERVSMRGLWVLLSFSDMALPKSSMLEVVITVKRF